MCLFPELSTTDKTLVFLRGSRMCVRYTASVFDNVLTKLKIIRSSVIIYFSSQQIIGFEHQASML